MHKYLSIGRLLFYCWFLGYNPLLAAKSVNKSVAKPVEMTSVVWAAQKAQITELFARQHYAKVRKKLEQLLPMLTNRSDRLEMQFLQAYCNFYKKEYEESSEQFHHYIEQYPSSSQIEEAVFMRGYSLACKDIDPRLDQTVTHTAASYLEQYLADYPEGLYVDKATNALKTLEEGLMKKSFNAAYFYFRMGYYRAAIVALKNFEQAYPNSCYKETIYSLLEKSREYVEKYGGQRERDSALEALQRKAQEEREERERKREIEKVRELKVVKKEDSPLTLRIPSDTKDLHVVK